jgi:hypothetical protein
MWGGRPRLQAGLQTRFTNSRLAACRNAGQAIVFRGLSNSASGARNFMKTIPPIFVVFSLFCHHVFSER